MKFGSNLDHEYINIAEIKFGWFYCGEILGANQFFRIPNANFC